MLVIVTIIITVTSTRMNADTGVCGGASFTLPFTDVPSSNIFFCSIAEAFFSGLTNGTTPTTYSPGDPVSRDQMAALISRTMDQSVKRTSRRAALDQFWTTQTENNLGLTHGVQAQWLLKSDGTDLWVATGSSHSVARVRASDGQLLGTWTGAQQAYGVLAAMGKVFVTGIADPGRLYQIDPTTSAGTVTTLTMGLGGGPRGIAFDGQRIWTANANGASGSVSIISLNPITVSNVSEAGSPAGIVFDGQNIWITDGNNKALRKLDSNAQVLLSVTVGNTPGLPVFDGTNIWVPNHSDNSVSVVRAMGALSGTVLATLTGNGLDTPYQIAFDGERILVTNPHGQCVSVWKASDLTPIGTFSTGADTTPIGVCSDGLNFWITLQGTGDLARF